MQPSSGDGRMGTIEFSDKDKNFTGESVVTVDSGEQDRIDIAEVGMDPD